MPYKNKTKKLGFEWYNGRRAPSVRNTNVCQRLLPTSYISTDLLYFVHLVPGSIFDSPPAKPKIYSRRHRAFLLSSWAYIPAGWRGALSPERPLSCLKSPAPPGSGKGLPPSSRIIRKMREQNGRIKWANKVCEQNGRTKYANKMCEQNVRTKCANKMYKMREQNVRTKCANKICEQNVQQNVRTKCANKMCEQNVRTKCANKMCEQNVRTIPGRG